MLKTKCHPALVPTYAANLEDFHCVKGHNLWRLLWELCKHLRLLHPTGAKFILSLPFFF